jgi:hypothetical protein
MRNGGAEVETGYLPFVILASPVSHPFKVLPEAQLHDWARVREMAGQRTLCEELSTSSSMDCSVDYKQDDVCKRSCARRTIWLNARRTSTSTKKAFIRSVHDRIDLEGRDIALPAGRVCALFSLGRTSQVKRRRTRGTLETAGPHWRDIAASPLLSGRRTCRAGSEWVLGSDAQAYLLYQTQP